MKKELTRTTNNLYYYKGEVRVDGKNPDMYRDCTDLSGDCSGLSGNCSGLSGDCSGLYGDCTGLSGNCSGLYGDCTGLRGDLDDCEITDEDREKGVDIKELIK